MNLVFHISEDGSEVTSTTNFVVLISCLVEWYIDNFHNWPDAERSLTPFPIGSNTMYYHKDDGTVIKVSKMPRCIPSNDSC